MDSQRPSLGQRAPGLPVAGREQAGHRSTAPRDHSSGKLQRQPRWAALLRHFDVTVADAGTSPSTPPKALRTSASATGASPPKHLKHSLTSTSTTTSTSKSRVTRPPWAPSGVNVVPIANARRPSMRASCCLMSRTPHSDDPLLYGGPTIPMKITF